MSLKDLHDKYKLAVGELRALTDLAEERTFTAEEEATYQRVNADVDGLYQRITKHLEDAERAASMSDMDKRMADLAAKEPPASADKPDGFDAELRAFLKGERRALDVMPLNAEQRVQVVGTNSAGGFTRQTSFYDQLQEHMIEVSAILSAGATILNTGGGEPLQIPKTTAHGTAALIAENAAITASDSTFGQVTLGAYKFARLVQVSNELVTDTTVDLLGYLARDCGRSVGNAFGGYAITGTGTAQPSGVVTGATLGVTGAASVVGAFSADNLIDLYYSVIAPYRASQSCAWLMRDATLANARKLKDTTNQYLWQPSIQVGAPETILGKPVKTDPNVAAVALSAKSVLFGDMSNYFVRQAGGFRFERSDDFAFSTDLVTFRCIARLDGALIDTTGAVKYFAGNAA